MLGGVVDARGRSVTAAAGTKWVGGSIESRSLLPREGPPWSCYSLPLVERGVEKGTGWCSHIAPGRCGRDLGMGDRWCQFEQHRDDVKMMNHILLHLDIGS